MKLADAQQMAKKLAVTDKKPYSIWLAENRKGEYIVRPYISYDQYRENFVEFVKCSTIAKAG